METAISMKSVTKKYDKFTLDHINLEIPKGSIVGLVGENGAGKTTLLKCILGLVNTDEGEISIEGKNVRELSPDWKNEIGVVMTGLNFMGTMNAREVGRCMKNFYSGWDEKIYEDYLKKFRIDPQKKIKEYSRGTSMKLDIAISLSHNASLLLFDEATSGLDPVVRDEILDILLEFIQDENHTAFISSHITSDLDKVADYIAFIHEGGLVFFKEKDELLYDYGVVHCSPRDFATIPGSYVVGVRKNSFAYDVMIKDRRAFERQYRQFPVDNTNIEEIILFQIRGEHV